MKVASVAKKFVSVVARADSEDLIRKGCLEEEKAKSKIRVAEQISKTIFDF